MAASIANMPHGGDRTTDQDANLRLDIETAATKLNVSGRSVNTAKQIKEKGSMGTGG